MKKEEIKINIITVFLLISIALNVVLGIFMYKINHDRKIVAENSIELQAKVDKLESVIDIIEDAISTVRAKQESEEATETPDVEVNETVENDTNNNSTVSTDVAL